MEYALIPSESRSCYFDEPDGWVEHKFNKVTLNPKESRELIMFCFADKYVVTRYFCAVRKLFPSFCFCMTNVLSFKFKRPYA